MYINHPALKKQLAQWVQVKSFTNAQDTFKFYSTTHQLHPTRDFFKLLLFLKKTDANKLLNGTTGAVGDIQHHHHAEQFINL